jgi:F0F1-type ATP synthase assembly protein I
VLFLVTDTQKKNNSSLKDFLKSPLIKTDSKTIQYSGLGVQLAVTILVFLFIGVWLDKKFNTEFIFTLILTFIGFGGGFYSFYLSINKLTKSKKENSEKPVEKK